MLPGSAHQSPLPEGAENKQGGNGDEWLKFTGAGIVCLQMPAAGKSTYRSLSRKFHGELIFTGGRPRSRPSFVYLDFLRCFAPCQANSKRYFRLRAISGL